jgi:membrane protease YdiL (CAAX protease family)
MRASWFLRYLAENDLAQSAPALYIGLVIPYEHILAVLIVVGFPIWDMLETRALKASIDPRRKIRTYRRILAVEWGVSLLAWIAFRSQLFFTWPGANHTVLQKVGVSFVLGLVSASVVVLVLQVFVTRFNSKLHKKVLAVFKRIAFILPVTREERIWFLLVSLTAGICEEILYRGYLIRYLADAPMHYEVWIAIAISSLAFGLAHGYQGIGGVVGTGVLGVVMAVIFVVTGSLWLPITLHAIIDLRILFLVSPGETFV